MLPKVAIYFLFETGNTILVVIAVYAFLQLAKLSELWNEFRTRKTMEFIPVHKISKIFGPPVSNQSFHYTRCNTPKRVASLRGPSPRHCARETQLLLKKCRSGDEPLSTLCPI